MSHILPALQAIYLYGSLPRPTGADAVKRTVDLDEIWQARYMPARRMQAANEPAYHAVKLDVCLTTNEIVAPFRLLTATKEPILVRPEEEVRIREAILSSSLTCLFFYDVCLIMYCL